MMRDMPELDPPQRGAQSPSEKEIQAALEEFVRFLIWWERDRLRNADDALD